MAKAYRWVRVGTRLLYKVRHHRGHGIHSPFVFNLINNVIEERHPYYAYEHISNHLQAFDEVRLKLHKHNLLMFRMVNYFNAKNILEIGSSTGVNTLCLTASASDIQCTCIEKDSDRRRIATLLYKNYERNITLQKDISNLPNNTIYDCIYINFDNYRQITAEDIKGLSQQCHGKSFIVAKGIRSNKRQKELWQNLCESESRTAMLDLFHIGIIFFDKQLSRWDYKISF